MTTKQEVIFWVMPLLFLLTSCVPWRDAKGTRHMLVVGVGIVSENAAKPEAARVMSANVLGVVANRGSLTVGLSSQFATSVPTNATDVRIEAGKSSVGAIKIEIQKAELRTNNYKPNDYKK